MHSVALIVGSLCVAGLMFEVLCRTVLDDGMHYHLEMWKYAVRLKEVSSNSAIGHEHITNTSAHLMGVDVRINSDGLREDEPVLFEADPVRILMLGDSVTFGWGVPKSQTVSEQMEVALSEAMAVPVQVINAGVGNYNTAMEAAWFEARGLALKPDVVVLNVFINDAEVMPAYRDINLLDRTLYSRVILFGAGDTVARKIFGGADWITYYRELYEETAPGWISMKAAIQSLADLCRDRGLPLLLVNYPELRQLDPYPFVDVSLKIQAQAERHRVPYVSLLPAVQGEAPEDLWVTPPDPHPNAYAAGLMADALGPVILNVLQTKVLRN